MTKPAPRTAETPPPSTRTSTARIRRTPFALAMSGAALLACCLGPAAAAVPPSADVPALDASVSDVPAAKLGRSWHPGCPVPPSGLRLIQMNHWGFDGRVHPGELVVGEQAVAPLLYVFERAFEAHFPIRQMQVMAEFDGDDVAAMAADNTSAFNCRSVTGDPTQVSQHSYGDAVDINTLENPYVDVNDVVYPSAGAVFLDRNRHDKGMIHRGDAISTAMREIGWLWGGRWSPPDYQHFSANGRAAAAAARQGRHEH
ncbi:M15 family metallopeptidase [Streptomyces sp. WM6378]|uniref:M15 family metallopeptidase n=1 Tax=Streptomyces sp. WM6378 TaxID=1415557 RepID=UPI000B1E9A11|nr:M15 family metallopeptidase [Streptomyces sp. WM6378]